MDFSVGINEVISGEEGSSIDVCMTVSSTLLSFETSLVVTALLADSELASEHCMCMHNYCTAGYVRLCH